MSNDINKINELITLEKKLLRKSKPAKYCRKIETRLEKLSSEKQRAAARRINQTLRELEKK